MPPIYIGYTKENGHTISSDYREAPPGAQVIIIKTQEEVDNIMRRLGDNNHLIEKEYGVVAESVKNKALGIIGAREQSLLNKRRRK